MHMLIQRTMWVNFVKSLGKVIVILLAGIMLGQAICPAEAPLLEKVVYNYHVNYWRGFDQQIVLKPFLLFFDYAESLVKRISEAGAFSEALQSIAYRGSNLYVYLKWPVLLLLGGTALYPLRRTVKKDFLKNLKRRLLSCIPYLLICVYPIGWYMLSRFSNGEEKEWQI